MTDQFGKYPFSELASLVLHQLDHHDSLFGIPSKIFFKPESADQFTISKFGRKLETPIGIAAGPQTQLAQNIIMAWLCGARFIELKTVQTLDELTVSKPCIDMQDEGYNCEWSQELKVDDSFDQYLNAWIIIHLLRDKLGHDPDQAGFNFNMSIGYDLQGIMKTNVQTFLDKMQNASGFIEAKRKEISKIYPLIKKIPIGSCISDNITLSTMHGCPPDEIESIAAYLLKERNLHTAIKLNPTLLGKTGLHEILSGSGFETVVPDSAFDHDIKMDKAIPMINRLQLFADELDLDFTLKLTNTLECINHKSTLPQNEKTMYMSGRALHPIAIELAVKLNKTLQKKPDISFCAGVDAFNVAETVESGLTPVTVCSDLLKPGGYGRLNQYIESLRNFKPNAFSERSDNENSEPAYLEKYADKSKDSEKFKKLYFLDKTIKTNRSLPVFDCAEAPCISTCPTHQNIPAYLHHTSQNEFEQALECILKTNPFPGATGLVCDHTCQYSCTRMDMDDPVRIRDVKRFISENSTVSSTIVNENKKVRVAIIGAGPSGLSCAYFAGQAGMDVEIFEAGQKPGGMVSSAIPSFRLGGEQLELDIERIKCMGIKVHYGQKIGREAFETIRKTFDHVYLSVGAQKSRRLKLSGSSGKLLTDPLKFLKNVKNGMKPDLGSHVIIIGGGNTAMDTARTAKRLVSSENGSVTILYRRTKKQMPAEQHEIDDTLKEGIVIEELVEPLELKTENNKIVSIRCQQMELGEKDGSGRAACIPVDGVFREFKASTVIPAIGQVIDIDFIEPSLLKHSIPYETQLKNVFIGGDAFRGASTLIHAIADGKNIAFKMIRLSELKIPDKKCTKNSGLSIQEHMTNRMTRKHAFKNPDPISANPVNFDSVNPIMEAGTAISEAGRCLHCDEVCNICTTVCPNMGLQYYPAELKDLKRYRIKGMKNQVSSEIMEAFRLDQKWQILHLTDWCNECGNCNTFCPSADAPYQVKPHLYFNKEILEQEKDGYHYNKNELTAVFGESTYILSEQKNKLYFRSDGLELFLDPDDLQLLDVRSAQMEAFSFDTKKVIEMYLILQGSKYIFGN